MTPNAQFQRLQNRVAAAFLAAFPEHKSVFSGDWGSASTSRNQAFPGRWKCLVSHLYIQMHCLLVFGIFDKVLPFRWFGVENRNSEMPYTAYFFFKIQCHH